jgi:hypothetical protein
MSLAAYIRNHRLARAATTIRRSATTRSRDRREFADPPISAASSKTGTVRRPAGYAARPAEDPAVARRSSTDTMSTGSARYM